MDFTKHQTQAKDLGDIRIPSKLTQNLMTVSKDITTKRSTNQIAAS